MHSDEDDVVVEENHEDGSETNLAQKLKQLRVKVALLEQEKSENLIGWQRSKADFINAQRRFEEEKMQLRSMVTEDIFSELLPILDSFDQAVLSIPPESPAFQGLANIRSLLEKVMERYGLTAIADINVPEDPRIHESIQLTPKNGNQQSHHVVQILQKGYKLGDRVIRAAKVAVSE
jgi:molecular chaperone GrpE